MSRRFVPRGGWRPLTSAVLAFAAVLFPLAVSAHPLGNFTINRYDGIRVSTTGVVIDHVLDMADGTVSDAEAATYAAGHCDTTAGALNVVAGGTPLALTVTARGIQFPQGQGAVTLRLVCTYQAVLPTPLAASAAFSPSCR